MPLKIMTNLCLILAIFHAFFVENHPRSKNLFLNAITEIKSEQDSIIDKLIKEVKVE